MVLHALAVAQIRLNWQPLRHRLVGLIQIDAGVLDNSDTSPYPRIQLDELVAAVAPVADKLNVSEARVAQRRKHFHTLFQQPLRPLRDTLDGPSALRGIGEQLAMGADAQRAALDKEPPDRIGIAADDFLQRGTAAISRLAGRDLRVRRAQIPAPFHQ